jgi:hypothetical protein
MAILFRFLLNLRLEGAVRNCGRIQQPPNLRLWSVKIKFRYFFVNFSFILFYHAGSVMHYGLGREMTTKLSTNGAVIGQRKGLSQVGLNKCNFQLATNYLSWRTQVHLFLK